MGQTRPPANCSNRDAASFPNIQPMIKINTPDQTGHTGNLEKRSTRMERAERRGICDCGCTGRLLKFGGYTFAVNDGASSSSSLVAILRNDCFVGFAPLLDTRVDEKDVIVVVVVQP
mmetsp:Transcript_16935/g.27486  ORF Transcript_16935/g.27486 Transcript_16935/m.27486 type:complete len:117 (-) Transcript_16935:487-837(-)